MKIDIVYVADELNVNLSGIFELKDISEVERRVDIILNDYEISNIKFNVEECNNLNKSIFNVLIEKYNNKIKEA